jgi:hypothetical protein
MTLFVGSKPYNHPRNTKRKTIDMENKGNTDTKQARKEDQCPRPSVITSHI